MLPSPASAEQVGRGAYVALETGASPRAILMATGSEVAVAVQAAQQLAQDGISVRVVSMPSWELFAAQPESYRQRVLPPSITARVAIEAASPFGWDRWTGDRGTIIAMPGFGASAPAERLFTEFGFTPAAAASAVRTLLTRSDA